MTGGTCPPASASVDHAAVIRSHAEADYETLDGRWPGFSAAYEVHTDDPDPTPFELAVAALGYDAAESVYIDAWSACGPSEVS